MTDPHHEIDPDTAWEFVSKLPIDEVRKYLSRIGYSASQIKNISTIVRGKESSNASLDPPFPPVFLLYDGITLKISTVHEAMRFLKQWPNSRRGPVYAVATRSLAACLEGVLKVDDARRAFESFARITGLLRRSEGNPHPFGDFNSDASASDSVPWKR